MSYETVTIEKKNAIGYITLNRPQQMNTFSSTMADELNRALGDLDNDDECRVVVVRGAGEAFSTGIDLGEFPGKNQEEYRRWVSGMDTMHFTIARMKKPVIAMVHGFVVANGAGLLAAADFAIAATGTKIGTSAINVGLLCTGPISPLSYCLSKKKTLEMLLCGDMISAEEALALGLVNRIVEPEKLEDETAAFAEKIISKSPVAVSLGKAWYYESMDMPLREKFENSSKIFAELCMTEDAQEGVSAFAEKRKPVWKGK